MKRFIDRLRWISLGCATVIILGVGGVVAYFVLSTPGRVAENIRASVYQLKSGEDLSSITIDGCIEAGEWERFKWYEASSGFAVYIANDNENLYVAIEEKQNVTDDGYRENAVLGFLPPGEQAKIEAGKFKAMEIQGQGRVFWKDWKQIIGLSVRNWRSQRTDRGYTISDEVVEKMAAMRNRNQEVQIYDEDDIVGGTEEEGPYLLIADNITDTPGGLIGKTTFDTHRAYEAQVPLSIIDPGTDQTLRVCGYTLYDFSPKNKYQYTPMGGLTKGSYTKKITSAFEVVSLDFIPEEPVVGETISVTAVVKNWYDTQTYTIRLSVDEMVRAEEKVFIAAGDIAEANFSLVIEEPGVHEVTVEDMSINFTVKEK